MNYQTEHRIGDRTIIVYHTLNGCYFYLTHTIQLVESDGKMYAVRRDRANTSTAR